MPSTGTGWDESLLLDGLEEVVWLLDEDGVILKVTPSFEKTFGLPIAGAVGTNLRQWVERDDIPNVERALERLDQDGAHRFLWRGRTWLDELIWLETSARSWFDPVARARRWAWFTWDVTQSRMLEEQYRQAQKLEGIGRLASGVAHDFNNLLTIILGYAGMVLDSLSPNDPFSPVIHEIQQAGRRAADLTRQLLAFSRHQVRTYELVNLNQVVRDLSRMLSRLLGPDVQFLERLESDIGLVQADLGQLEQVLMNLIVNARDAMPEGGKLLVKTRKLDWTETGRVAVGAGTDVADIEPGPYVELAVRDSGMGMDEATMARIFEPFFTTKDESKGTGLGLATVYAIVKQAGGHVWVESQPGYGSTFHVLLPRLDSIASPDRVTDRVEPPIRSARGRETILVVEDDTSIRRLLETTLSRQGYEVISVSDGLEALEADRRHAGTIDLLLTDLMMPRMTGRELADKLRVRRPTTKLLFVSGNTDDTFLRNGVLNDDLAFLPKPFTPQVLCSKVRQVLDAS